MLERRFKEASLRLSILKNLASITYAFLTLSKGGRSGSGRDTEKQVQKAVEVSQ